MLADRLAGMTVSANPVDFTEPWRRCWQAIEASDPGQEFSVLEQAVNDLPDKAHIYQSLFSVQPGRQFHPQSLEELAKTLRPIEWVWPGWIPRSMMTVLGASQGSGKSFVAVDLCHRIIHNQGYPDGAPIVAPGANVIYVDAEAVPQILNERAQNYGIDRSKLFLLLPQNDEMIDLGVPRYQDMLGDMALLLKPELIIIDSLSVIHSQGQDKVEQIRSLFGFLTRLVKEAASGLLLIHHIRKPATGNQRMLTADFGMEDLAGSGFITQQARTVIGMRLVQTGPEFNPNGPREFKILKSNLGAYPAPLGFEFAPGKSDGVVLSWSEPPRQYKEPTQMEKCADWLVEYLLPFPEGVKVSEIIEEAATKGFSRTTTFRAKDERKDTIISTAGRRSPDNRWKLK